MKKPEEKSKVCNSLLKTSKPELVFKYHFLLNCLLGTGDLKCLNGQTLFCVTLVPPSVYLKGRELSVCRLASVYPGERLPSVNSSLNNK